MNTSKGVFIMAKSKHRIEIGEKAWAEYQIERKRKKSRNYYKSTGQYTTSWRIRVKQKLLEYKGSRCEICGYSKDVPGAYDFHHLDPNTKEFGISSSKVLNFEKLKKEVDKCQLLCRNCHAEVHHKQNQSYRQSLLHSNQNWLSTRLQEKACSVCGKYFQPSKSKHKFCGIECSTTSRRKVLNPPDRNTLLELMRAMTWQAIGQKYNVSGNAVKKWAKKMNITWEPYKAKR